MNFAEALDALKDGHTIYRLKSDMAIEFVRLRFDNELVNGDEQFVTFDASDLLATNWEVQQELTPWERARDAYENMKHRGERDCFNAVVDAVLAHFGKAR